MNLDLTKILKDCPIGTKFYSRSIGTVTFNCIKSDRVCIKNHKGIETAYTKSGKFYYAEEDAEIDLFPSKEQRDWSKWQRPFVKGDILVSEMGNIVLCSHIDENQLVHYNCLLNPYDNLKISNDVGVGYSYECTLATEKEKQKLFDALKKEGYEWNEETKELKKFEPKFDISTLKPFDKVLCRMDDYDIWGIDMFERYLSTNPYPFLCLHHNFNQCVPYNDETEHLLGTTNDASRKYINW